MQAVKPAPDAAAVRVQFGPRVRRTVATEVARLGATRVLILSTPGRSDTAEEVATALYTAAAGTFSKATMHTPVAVTLEALDYLETCAADRLIAIGGGSTTGLSKALTIERTCPDHHPDHLCRQ